MDLEAKTPLQIFIFVDEAGFNLVKICWHGRNVIGRDVDENLAEYKRLAFGCEIYCCISLYIS